MTEFVRLNQTISNVVTLSNFASSDPFVAMLGDGPADFGKMLALTSARNRGRLDRKAFFDRDPVLAGVWYSAYAEIYRTGLLDPVVLSNLREHFAFNDPRLDVQNLTMTSYFASTYVGENRDRNVRSIINRSWKQAASALQSTVRNRPDTTRIAILSSSWTPSHSAYRICKAYVEALAGYHLTFVPLGSRRGLDFSLFQEVRTLAVDRSGVVDIRGLLDNDFAAVYYPDIGLSTEGILLTNLRIAPVQIASLGHSVSTWGAEIDYFFSGAEVEPPDHPERNYSERLVLLPGNGAVHERPAYIPVGKAESTSAAPFIFNCPWNAQKVNEPFAMSLKELIGRSPRPVRLRLFVSASLNRQNDYLPFVRDLHGLLGAGNVDIVRDLPYNDYMARMERGDASLDSFPFGGCNTVVDSLFLRRLTICREGDTWYNRIGPALLRMVGLGALVATNEREYVDIAVRLIADAAWRASLQETLDRPITTIFDRSEALAFRKAVDFLVANHEQLRNDPDRSPIRITE